MPLIIEVWIEDCDMQMKATVITTAWLEQQYFRLLLDEFLKVFIYKLFTQTYVSSLLN